MRNTPPPTRRVRTAHESKSATVRAAAAARSRRQQSKWQREQHQQHRLYIAIGVMLVVVAGIFLGGLYYDNVLRANEVVAQIGQDTVTAAQLLGDVRPAAKSLDAQAKQFGGGTNIAQYVDQQKRSLPDQTLSDNIDKRLIQQEAARRNISVSPTELDDKERQTVADFQAVSNPSPTPAPTSLSDTGVAADTAPTAPPPPVPTPAPPPSPPPPPTPTTAPTLDASGYAPALQQLLDTNNPSAPDFP